MIAVAIVLLLQGQPADTLTLEAALARAHAHRGQVAAAIAGVNVARAGVGAAGQIPNPTVSYTRTQDLPRQHLVVDQSFEWLLVRGPERTAAFADLAGARADSAAIVGDLDQSVRVAFFSAVAARERARLADGAMLAADSLVSIAEARFQAGDISQFERDQVSLDAGRARLDWSLAQEAEQVARVSLARAIGWPEGPLPVPAGALDLGLDTTSAAAPVVEDLPEVRRARADSLAASARLSAASRRSIPLPTLQAGADWDDPSQPGRALSIIGIAIPVPLWNHNGAGVAESRAQADLAAARATEARLSATERIRSALIRLEEAARRARFARDSLAPAAGRLRARALLAYRAGETGVVPVLDALRAERESTAQMIDALAAWQEARAQWIRLRGDQP